MNVVIIEDEKPAAEKLQKALQLTDPSIAVLAVLNTVQSSVEWLQQHSSPELIFMDIELTDGLSFRIFDSVSISCPVIFTTAYDEYWQDAFEHNSIDYLLKPIKEEKLKIALQKYEKLKSHFAFGFKQLLQWQHNGANSSVKKRFLVKRGGDYLAIKTEDIAYFYATHKLVCLVDSKGQKFILDKSLADVEKEVDSSQFYRLNRKYLANVNAIKKIKAYPKSKLLIDVDPAVGEEIIISQENVAAFKQWIAQ
ncbi:MAG: LytTR family DNA-binding domain-containing protein [Chitinophagaceae bacterium]